MKWIVAVAAIVAFLAGCWQRPNDDWLINSSAATDPSPPAGGDAGYLRKAAVKSEADVGAENAVESALVWSEKYSRAVEKIALLQGENRQLEEKNQKLSDQLEKVQAELAQSQKELSDASSLLLEMRGELERWKTNVLGFREEIRQAQQAQLDATGKVLRLLGGEVVQPATQPAEAKEVARKEKEVVSAPRH